MVEVGCQLESGKHLPSVPQQLKDHVIIVALAPTKVKGKPSIDSNELWSSFKISPAYVVLTLWKPKASQFNYTHPGLKQGRKYFHIYNNQGFVSFERKASAFNGKDSNLLSKTRKSLKSTSQFCPSFHQQLLLIMLVHP